MACFYVTFSPRYRSESHPVADVEPDGYVLVEAEDYDSALRRTYEVFSAYFDGIKTEDEFDPADYPLGMLYSI